MITAHKHIPAMHQRNRLDDCQPQTMVVAAVAARRIDPVDALEQSRQMLIGNSAIELLDTTALQHITHATNRVQQFLFERPVEFGPQALDRDFDHVGVTVEN